jgi:UDP-N-acetylmuramate--alanine ligase
MFRGRRIRIHFVGIGGIGMSGIAEVLLNLGYDVRGSDASDQETTRRLARLGGRIHRSHAAEHVGDAEVVVISSAIGPDNAEVAEARTRGIPVIARAEMLAELMRMKYGIAIAGSHGKTTTTSLVATIMLAGGLDPTVVVGGKLSAFGSSARLGAGDTLVAEADESDGSFLHLSPTVAVVTNIDHEHLGHYGSFERLVEAFRTFAAGVPFYGAAVLCADHPQVMAIAKDLGRPIVTYGFAPTADFRATNTRFSGVITTFEVSRRGQPLGEFSLAMPGAHNAENALAALAVADFLGIDLESARQALAGFGGVARRFTQHGEAAGVLVVDDYGHHPAEIDATLAGARGAFPERRLVVAFQPHRHTRTRDLFDDLANSFAKADVTLLADVYGAGEAPIPGIDSARLAEAVRAHGKDATHVGPRARVAEAALAVLRPGDLFLALGAGDIVTVADEVLGHLQRR